MGTTGLQPVDIYHSAAWLRVVVNNNYTCHFVHFNSVVACYFRVLFIFASRTFLAHDYDLDLPFLLLMISDFLAAFMLIYHNVFFAPTSTQFAFVLL